MGLGDRPHDRQTEAGSPARAGGIGTRETLESVGQELGQEARSAVEHVQLDEAVMLGRSHHDRAVTEAQRVVDHVAERLIEPRDVGVDEDLGLRLDGHRALDEAIKMGVALGDHPHRPVDLEALVDDRQTLVVALGDDEQILGQ